MCIHMIILSDRQITYEIISKTICKSKFHISCGHAEFKISLYGFDTFKNVIIMV